MGRRELVLRNALGEIFGDSEYRELALLTGPNWNGKNYGYTFSDITQRFIPNLLIEAFPDSPLTFQLAKSVLDRLEPTAPFGLTELETKR